MADTKEQNPKASSATTKGDAGEKEMQERFDEANEKGFFGTEVDPTPNENYTVKGVTSGAPTPETDAGARKAARNAADDAGEAAGNG
jgi:hypothetical protein